MPPASHPFEGWLTDNRIEAPTGQGEGALAARFIVQREGQVAHDRELRTRSSWNSVFVGIEAVPAALNHYMQMHRALVGLLLDDPDFRRAARPR